MENFDLPQIFAGYMCFLFSICFHEMGHAWMAKRKGDRTAEMMGRLSMNPMVHADLIGTVLLPLSAAFGNPYAFGWAKPVPVNERNLRHPQKDMFWVAFAGPLANFLLAAIATIVLAGFLAWGGQALTQGQVQFQQVLFGFIEINLMLAFFNLLPIHPLDGGKILARFLSVKANNFLDEKAHFLNIALIVLFILGAFSFLRPLVRDVAMFFLTYSEFALRMAS
jgi:Zn-dependent protease